MHFEPTCRLFKSISCLSAAIVHATIVRLQCLLAVYSLCRSNYLLAHYLFREQTIPAIVLFTQCSIETKGNSILVLVNLLCCRLIARMAIYNGWCHSHIRYGQSKCYRNIQILYNQILVLIISQYKYYLVCPLLILL